MNPPPRPLRATTALLLCLSLGLALPTTLGRAPASAHGSTSSTSSTTRTAADGARVQWITDRVSAFKHHAGHPSAHTKDARAVVSRRARSSSRKRVAARKAYSSAVAAEKRAATRLKRAGAALRTAQRDLPALRDRARTVTSELLDKEMDLEALQWQVEDAETQVEWATEELDGTLAQDDADGTDARQALVAASAELARLRGQFIRAESEVTELGKEEKVLAAAVDGLESTVWAGTRDQEEALASAKRRTFTKRAAMAKRATPASTKRAPYSVHGKGRNVWFWDACSGPVTVKVSTPAVRGERAKKVAVSEARRAVKHLKKVSGLPLKFKGRTSEVPRASKRVRTADIVISYTSPTLSPGLGLGGRVVGIGGSWAITSDRGESLRFSGFATIDAAVTQHWKGGRYPKRMDVTLHELGHAIGLGHATRRSEIMYPSASPSTPDVYGSGDRNGLRRLRAYSRC